MVSAQESQAQEGDNADEVVNNIASKSLEEEETSQQDPTSKQNALQTRLRKLKQKMNQARQLNLQAVKEESQKSDEKAKEKRMMKEAETDAWQAHNSKAIATAREAGIDAKALTQQAEESVHNAQMRTEKAELHQHSVSDDYNPEGQHRHYERDVKTLGRYQQDASDRKDTYNPFSHDVDPEKEREGARRVAQEMYRRIEKSKKNQEKKRSAERDGDVSYINKRNKKFNEKLSRTYDASTREIRESLERGTAL